VKNGLVEVEKVMDSEAVLIANKGLSASRKKIVEQMLFRFKAVERSRGMKYVLMNIPCGKVDEAVKILPGMKSPTILPLAQEGWCSLHVVIRDGELWEKIEGLKEIGAEDILVLALEKMIL
jgi:ATP phosphoribosyltransferase